MTWLEMIGAAVLAISWVIPISATPHERSKHERNWGRRMHELHMERIRRQGGPWGKK